MSEQPTGVIHDIGYQRYDGPRLGRAYAARSLYTHGLRTAFGLGRSAKAKIFPWAVAGIIGIVAVVLTVVRAQSGEAPVSYAEYPETLTIPMILFCAVVAPELVSRDLRTGVLPLYFSRPIMRSDYALVKLAALVTAAWLPVAAGQLLMFTGAAFDVSSIREFWTELGDLLPGLAYSALHALVFGAVALLVASLASRRAVAAAAIVAVFLVTTPIVGVLYSVGGETGKQLAWLASPTTLVGGVGDWLFEVGGKSGVGDYGPLYGVVAAALVGGCAALLLARYRRVAR
ncbi:MAG TPA: ABC transporter permease [Micromonosporaceae bacterium]|jgi:ABC-2 type transport system permease protein